MPGFIPGLTQNLRRFGTTQPEAWNTGMGGGLRGVGVQKGDQMKFPLPASPVSGSALASKTGGPPVMDRIPVPQPQGIAVGEPNPSAPAPTNYDPWAPGASVAPTEDQLRARFDSRQDFGKMFITNQAAKQGLRPIDIILNRWYRRHPGAQQPGTPTTPTTPTTPPIINPTTPGTPTTPASPALTQQGVMQQIAQAFNGGANNIYDPNRLFPMFGV